MTTLTAVTASRFVNSLGVNTHIDFNAYGYENLTTVESALKYLGVKNVRDSAESSSDLTTWQQVAQATGVKFDDYMPEGSPADMQSAYNLITQLAQEGVLNFIEGGNEEDDDYAISQGNSLSYTANFQQQVYALGQQLHLPVINMSFGSGWTAANNWQGDYGAVGDLSAYANYGNAHTYPMPGQMPDNAIQQLNADALLAASTRPVITTEIGWDNATFSQAQVAQYVVQAALDGMKDGNPYTYFYSLFDDGSGQFGLMNADGTPKPAGTALHNLISLLTDTGSTAGTFTPGSLTFTLTGAQSTDNMLLIQKSDGSDWLAIWDESAAKHTITLTLAGSATQILVFDPVTGTSSIASVSNSGTIALSLGNDPLLVEIIGPPSGTTTGSGGSTSSSGTSTSLSPNPVLTVPMSASVAANSTVTIKGVSVADPWAGTASGTMALNVTATTGTITMLDASGNRLSGSGTASISVNGSLAQINAELATLSYTAGTSNGTIDVDVWDQSGVEANKSFGITVSALTTTVPHPVFTVPASERVVVGNTITVSGVSIADPWAATASGPLTFKLTATGGTVAVRNVTAATINGSGSSSLTIKGSLAQINNELKTLVYTAGKTAGTGAINVDIIDQGGAEAKASIGVTIAQSTTPTITIAATDANPVETVSSTTIVATSGNHMIFIGGSNDVLIATGGTETVQAYQGKNTITTGTGNDTIYFAGSGNRIDAGSGNNMLGESGGGNTIVLPGAGLGYDDIYGYVMTNSDVFDLRPLLASTKWTGSSSTIGSFVSMTLAGNSAEVNVTPSGVAGSTHYKVATFEDSGAVSLSTLLSHAII